MPKPIPASQASPSSIGDHYLDRAQALGITYIDKTFVRAGIDWDYYVFHGSGDPPHDIGARGDLFESASSGFWFRDIDKWKPVMLGEKDGRPIQKHPTLKADRCLRTSDLTWVCYSGYKFASNKRARELEDKERTFYGSPVACVSKRVETTIKDQGSRPVYPAWHPQMLHSPASYVGVQYAAPVNMPLAMYPLNWFSPPNQAIGARSDADTGKAVERLARTSPEHAVETNGLRTAASHISAAALTDDLIPQLGNAENLWMVDIYKQILAHPDIMPPPLMERCKTLWRLLMGRSEVLQEIPEDGIKCYGPPKTKLNNKLSLHLVMLDMICPDNTMVGVDYTNNTTQNDIQAADVFASVMGFSEGDWNPVRSYWGVLQIPASNSGVRAARIDTDDFTKDGTVYLQDNWETAFVPAGAITQPHTDYNGCDQFNIHICGDKVWITWPATEKNLKWLSLNRPIVGAAPHDLVLRAVEELDGLRLHRFKKGDQQVFTMDPCRIHAVMTLSTSAHTGVCCLRKEHFRDAMRLLRYHIDFAQNRPQYGLSVDTSIGMLQAALVELNMWKKVSFLDDDEKFVLGDVFDYLQIVGNDMPAPIKPGKKRKKVMNGR